MKFYQSIFKKQDHINQHNLIIYTANIQTFANHNHLENREYLLQEYYNLRDELQLLKECQNLKHENNTMKKKIQELRALE